MKDGSEAPPAPAPAEGCRMPAEWEPQEAVWVVTPHNEETWPGCLAQARAQFEAWTAAMGRVVAVHDAAKLGIATNDSWIRDFGPIFVTREPDLRSRSRSGPALVAHDFRFNGWGGKYESRDLDDAAARRIVDRLGCPRRRHDLVLEGGAIEINGRGTVMTTEQCLLHPNRNPTLTPAKIEQQLHRTLGTRHCIWLPGGIVGDDTDGHVDDIARFVAEDLVLAVAPPADANHPDQAMLAHNLAALRRARDQDGRPLRIVELPAPEPIVYDFPPDRFGPGGVRPLPASYANFLISNGAVFVPVFGQPRDEQALRVFEQAMPAHRIVPLRAEHLVVGLGALHCLSQQQPAVSPCLDGGGRA